MATAMRMRGRVLERTGPPVVGLACPVWDTGDAWGPRRGGHRKGFLLGNYLVGPLGAWTSRAALTERITSSEDIEEHFFVNTNTNSDLCKIKE